MSQKSEPLKLILASGNQHKADEFSTLLDSSTFIISAAPEKIEVDESGSDYYQNAYLKAKGYYDRFKTPVFSDDSGLTVAAFPDQLGVHSARYGGEGLSDRQRVELLLANLEQLPAEEQQNRAAYFTAVLCFYLGPQEVFYFEGRVEGTISCSIQGDRGFGYDPIFLPAKLDGEESFAENPEWKAGHSHRAIAAAAANSFFANR